MAVAVTVVVAVVVPPFTVRGVVLTKVVVTVTVAVGVTVIMLVDAVSVRVDAGMPLQEHADEYSAGEPQLLA